MPYGYAVLFSKKSPRTNGLHEIQTLSDIKKEKSFVSNVIPKDLDTLHPLTKYSLNLRKAEQVALHVGIINFKS